MGRNGKAMAETTSFWSDAQGWGQVAQYCSTIQAADIDGDRRSELVAHGNGWLVAAKWDTNNQKWNLLSSEVPCPDADGWNQPQCYQTIQAADLDGDGQEEVLGRDAQGIVVWKCDKTSYQWVTLTRGPGLSDANGWNQPQYYSTIQCADVDGDGQRELLARGSGGISIWKCDKTSHQWSALPDGPALRDANGWNQPQYYGTIRCADVDGDGQAELLARGSGGISVWKCDKISHQWSALPSGPAISDADGWNQPQYYSTMRCADVDGDGQAELLVRGSAGISIWKCDRSTHLWSALLSGPALSDANGWNQPQYYSTIRCADLDGDGQAELLARGAGGISIWKCDKTTHQWTTLPDGPAWSDANGWNQPQYYSTIRCADIDGNARAELIARSSAGIITWNLNQQPAPSQPAALPPQSIVGATQHAEAAVHSAVEAAKRDVAAAQSAAGEAQSSAGTAQSAATTTQPGAEVTQITTSATQSVASNIQSAVAAVQASVETVQPATPTLQVEAVQRTTLTIQLVAEEVQSPVTATQPDTVTTQSEATQPLAMATQSEATTTQSEAEATQPDVMTTQPDAATSSQAEAITPDQLHSLLQNCLQTVGQESQLVISRATFNDVRINQLMDTYYGGSNIVITSAVINVDDTDASQIVVTGKASFLNVVNMPVKATFQTSSGQVDLVLCYQLPTTWKFSQSFPTLPATWMPSSTSLSSSIDSSVPSCSILDLLTFTNASFIVSTKSYTDQTYQVQMRPGLNFVCDLRLNGLLGAIEKTLGIPEPLTLAGPIIMPSPSPATNPLVPLSWPPTSTTAPLPGINLKADVKVNLSIEQMTLKDMFVAFYSPLAKSVSHVYYDPGLFFGGMLQIGEHLSVELVAEKMLGDDSQLLLSGTFDGLTLPDLSQLADLVGGDDLLNSLVPQGSAPFVQGSSLSIRSTTLLVTCSPFTVDSASLVIGLDGATWCPLDGIETSGLEALFRINSPFNSQRSLQAAIYGTMSIGDITLDMSASAPDFTVTALLPQGHPVSLKSALAKDFPELPGIGDLTVDTFYLAVQPARGFLFSAALADQPQPWTIELGPETLTLMNMRLLLNYAKGAGFSGLLSGSLTLAGVQLDASCQYPGPITLRGQFPSLSMKTLVTHLCGEDIAWPSGFDIDLEQSSVLIQERNGNLSLNVAGEVKDLGLFALTIQKQAKWGVALGIDLSLNNLASLPGLGVLAPFESFVGLNNLMLVFSSLDQQPNFQFPDLANFNVPSLGNQKVMLPQQANGLATGLNIYGQLNTTQSKGFQALAKYLGIRLDGSMGMVLAVSLPDPATNSKFFLSVNEEIQKGTTLQGELGGFLQGSDVGAFLTAVVKTKAQGQPLEFDVIATVLESGVLISGTMQGTLHFDAIQLSNLALVIGIDFEGIPSLGIAATLDVSTFDTALALFFDSTDPAKSLVAGALSNVSLLDIARTFAGQISFPQGLDKVLGLIGLKGLSAFNMPAAVAVSLDHRDVSAIANAFKQYGGVTIPSTSDHILLVINKPGASWHLTDLSTMKHYSLALQGNNIAVALEAQLYLAPQVTYIGSLQYPSGFNVIAQIDYLLIQAEVNIQISPQRGIMAEVDLAPITLLNRDFFSITGANGQRGARLSLATYAQPHLTDPQLRDPHLLLSGTLRLLGADMAGIYAFINEHGLSLQVSYQVNPALHVDLHGTIDGLSNLNIGGGVLVGIDRSLDLGQLGSLSVKTDVNGQLSMAYTGKTPSACFTGGFVFQNTQYTLPALTLDVNGPALQNITETLWQQISGNITNLLKDPDRWLSWVHSGVIQGTGQTAEEVGKVLSSVYHLSGNDITTKTQKIMGYGADEATRALKGAGIEVSNVANDAVNAAKNVATGAASTVGNTAEKAGKTIKHWF
jgi:hypothetical protein